MYPHAWALLYYFTLYLSMALVLLTFSGRRMFLKCSQESFVIAIYALLDHNGEHNLLYIYNRIFLPAKCKQGKGLIG
jgi:hypothetical protein